jgi:hypothetical protein
MEVLIIIFFAMLFLIIVGLVWWGYRRAIRQAAERRQALAGLARSWDLGYFPDDPFNLASRFEGFAAIDRGHSRCASNVLSGIRKGRGVAAFDYQYTISSGKSESTYYLSALALADRAKWPRLLIRPKGFLDKIAAAAGFNDIDFESHEFSRRFFVKGPDPRFAYDVITPKMMEYLMANDGWHIEMANAYLMVYDSRGNIYCRQSGPLYGNMWEPRQFEEALAMAEGFLDLVPEFVWKDHRSDGEEIESFLPRKRHIGIAPQRIAGKPGMGRAP